jgi:D-alanyl-D-alanine carboxypeptidase
VKLPFRALSALATSLVAILAVSLLCAPRALASSAPADYSSLPTVRASLGAPNPIVRTGTFTLREQPLSPGTQAIVRVEGECLRMRTGAGLDAPLITCLPEGTAVLVMPSTQETPQYRWQLVTAGTRVGWVADQYLQPAQSTTACTGPALQSPVPPPPVVQPPAAQPPVEATPAVQPPTVAQPVAQPPVVVAPSLSAQLPVTGIGAAVWSGGATAEIVAASLAQGCRAESIWTQGAEAGTLVGYLTGVPDFVNNTWQTQFPTSVPAGTIVFVVCGGPAPSQTTSAISLSAPVSPSSSATAAIGGTVSPPVRVTNTPPPGTWGLSAVVIDADSGAMLYEKDPHKKLAPASLTKIATAIVALEGASPDQWVANSIDSRRLGDSSVMGLVPGDCLQMRDLLYGLMLPSGNDAALAIAGFVAGSDTAFVSRMNALVRRLGLQDTSFIDPHGLGGPGHYSSAYDLAMLARFGMTLPLFRDVVSARSWTSHGTRPISLATLNQFLTTYPGADGLKTGYTEEAGRTLAVSATRNGHRLIAVLLNDDQRYPDARSLMDWAFANYRWP